MGVGHEVDVSLADMAADVRAATPSNAAQILVPDRKERIGQVRRQIQMLLPRTEHAIDHQRMLVAGALRNSLELVDRQVEIRMDSTEKLRRVLAELDPNKVLARGYALLRGDESPGSMLEIEKRDKIITAEVRHVHEK